MILRPLAIDRERVIINTGVVTVPGDLQLVPDALGLVIFAHGSGSSRRSARNVSVAQTLNEAGLSTLLFDLLTPDEVVVDERTRELRFNIPLLAARLIAAVDWASRSDLVGRTPIGCFGASTGAAAALIAAAERPHLVRAVVSRGGRPDLAGAALSRVSAPTLLLVGGQDEDVLDLNRGAALAMRCPVELEIIPGATHLFEEPGALGQVADLAAQWFRRHLSASPVAPS